LSIAEDAIAVHVGPATVELRKGFDQELFGEIIQVLQTI
ncbi:MAG: IS66 family insertion sequence element accessory protein TnpB, partial [Dehalococcoidales bacterium]|nr:IS66 family insertion sequence element accessory protein TnpB [Dehalococcoidales bacterium]